MQIKEGELTRIIFNNKDNGYTVAGFETDDEEFTITGNFHAPAEGLRYRITGSFKVHSKYGEQFVVSEYEEILPSDSDGIRAFLSSGTIKGIGYKTADLIVDKFGISSLEILENEPERFLEIHGIGKKTLEKILNSYNEGREFAQISFSLREYGITTSQAVRIYSEYGNDALDIIEENPYALAEDIRGISFRGADAIAEKIGIDKNSEFRVSSGIKYILINFAASGSTFVPRDIVIEKACSLLEVSSENIEDVLISMAFSGDIKTAEVGGIKAIYLYGYYASEARVAFDINRILSAKAKELPIRDLDVYINEMERKKNSYRSQDEQIELSKEQHRAIYDALTNNICIITGGPGTGKTIIINFIASIFKEIGIKTAISAPTGRAAKRITETSGFSAMTVHRMLGYVFTDDNSVRFTRNEDNPLDEEAIIVDEASMIDILLMEGLLKAIKDGARVIFVGDSDQLPSVGAGNVLRDMIKSEAVHTTKLKEIFRQAKESNIIVNAHMINDGEYPEYGSRDSDFFMINDRSKESIVKLISELNSKRLERYYDFIESWRDIQVLTPTKKGVLGTHNLNLVLQNVLNPRDNNKNEKKYGNKVFREGDRVMQIVNDYDIEWKERGGLKSGELGEGSGIFNGDMGVIISIDNTYDEFTVDYDGKIVTYKNENLDEIEHAYAITVHKSQGSEFKAIIMPIANTAPMLMTRNLLYTGVTRGKNLVILIGSEYILRGMIDNNRVDERYTGLAERLGDSVWDFES